MSKAIKCTPAFLQALKLDYRRVGGGHFTVSVTYKHDVLGVFATNNAPLVDDIDELNNGGNEADLIEFLSFNELKMHCLTKIDF